MEIKEDVNVYEAGYHLVPTLAEDAVPAEAQKIKDLIIKAGGEVISEGEPELRALAYTITKKVKSTTGKYNKAFFGWVKFTLTPSAVEEIKTALDASPVVLRYLIVSTIKESTLVADKEKRVIPEGASKEEEIDTAIEELVTNS